MLERYIYPSVMPIDYYVGKLEFYSISEKIEHPLYCSDYRYSQHRQFKLLHIEVENDSLYIDDSGDQPKIKGTFLADAYDDGGVWFSLEIPTIRVSFEIPFKDDLDLIEFDHINILKAEVIDYYSLINNEPISKQVAKDWVDYVIRSIGEDILELNPSVEGYLNGKEDFNLDEFIKEIKAMDERNKQLYTNDYFLEDNRLGSTFAIDGHMFWTQKSINRSNVPDIITYKKLDLLN